MTKSKALNLFPETRLTVPPDILSGWLRNRQIPEGSEMRSKVLFYSWLKSLGSLKEAKGPFGIIRGIRLIRNLSLYWNVYLCSVRLVDWGSGDVSKWWKNSSQKIRHNSISHHFNESVLKEGDADAAPDRKLTGWLTCNIVTNRLICCWFQKFEKFQVTVQ